MKSAVLFSIFLALQTGSFSQKPSIVKIIKQDNGYQLIRNGERYFIKGAVGSDYLDRLVAYGGNSIRTRVDPQILQTAQDRGLSILVNLPVKAERDGMDYNDTAAVRIQHEKVLSIVRQYKDHPAVLIWALGNELEFVKPNVECNIKVWPAVDKLAQAIHKLDPNHPVMTVVGASDQNLIGNLARLCPSLDLLGVNAYGDLEQVPDRLRRYGWQKPYAVTEWGPTGFWQVKNTPWKAPIEETSTLKAKKYKERYEHAILGDSTLCLGSYVFLWRQHQERTHTWFGMFDANGLETEAVDVMNYEWSGKWPSNRAPVIDSVKLEGRTAYDENYLTSGTSYAAKVWAKDPENESLRFDWEILKEGTNFPYGGNGEKKPPEIEGLINEKNSAAITFKSPQEDGPYRLFVYVYDNNGNWATANIPFYLKKK